VSTAVAPARVEATTLRIAARQDVLALAGLALLVGSLAILTWGTWGDLDSDTGFDLVAASRVADGQLPYADFVYFYGPLSPLLQGLAFLLGGSGLGPAVGFGLTIALAIVAATYALARVHAPPLGAFLAASITAAVAFVPNNYSFVLPYTNAATLGTLVTLLFLLFQARYAATGSRRWLVASGVAAGLTALTKPEFALAAFVAASVWLASRARARLSGLKDIGLFAGPAAAVALLGYGGFLLSLSPGELLFENLYPVDTLEAAGNALLDVRAPLTAASVVDLALRLALYAAGIAGLLLAGRALARKGALGRVAVALVAVVAVAAIVGALANPEALRHGLQYAYGWIPAGAVVALGVLLLRRRRQGSPLTAAFQADLAVLTVLAVLALTTYAAFFLHAPKPQMAVFYAPFAAVFLARLHLVWLARTRAAATLGALWLVFLAAAGVGLTLKDARAESEVVRGPGGALRETPSEARVYQAALDWIGRESEPGAPVLVAPVMTGLYALSERSNPLPQISLLPGALPAESDELQAIRKLRAAGVRLAITDRRQFPAYDHGPFGVSFDRVLAGWIEARFDHVATIRGDGNEPLVLDVWRLRE
jgi:hypothetical protein